MALLLLPTLPGEVRTTELHLRAEGADELPARVAPGETLRVRVGVAAHEERLVSYRLVARIAEGPDAGAVLDEWRLDLEPGERREDAREWVMPAAPGERTLSVELFREGDAEPHRRVHLLVDVAPPGAPTGTG